MQRKNKFLIGFLSVVLLMAVIIVVSVYFSQKASNQTPSSEFSSNTTIKTTLSALTSTFMSTTSVLSTSTISTSITSGSITSIAPNSSTISTSSTSGNTASIASNSSTVSTSSTPGNTASITPNSSTISTSITSVNMTLTTNTNLTTSITTVIVSTSSGFTCQLGFQSMQSYTTEEFVGPMAVAVGKFNGDSFLDIVVANYDDASVGVLLGNGDGTFQPESKFFITNHSDPIAIAVGDFNNDNRLDTVVTNIADANMAILLGNGDGTLIAQRTMSTGTFSYPASVAVGYFNQDNALDIAVANSGTNRVGLFIGNGNGTFQNQRTLQTGTGSEPSGIAVADFNHDNYSDLAVSNFGTNRVGVFLGNGNGTFRTQITFPVGSGPAWINIADFNNDTHLDIAVLNMDNNTIGILLGIGNGTFGTQSTYFVGNSNSSYFFTIADANNDGRWDIVIPNTQDNNIGILLGKGDGSFEVQTIFSTGDESGPSGLAVADFNNDHRSDIVVANVNTNEIGLLLGTC